jgi:hypothetical protein
MNATMSRRYWKEVTIGCLTRWLKLSESSRKLTALGSITTRTKSIKLIKAKGYGTIAQIGQDFQLTRFISWREGLILEKTKGCWVIRAVRGLTPYLIHRKVEMSIKFWATITLK